ncbi:MAG: hypothetical protein KAT17_09515 [Candidatus Aminicenantes bacterium]|nr:hypothetical protein [Candidatus Aminicenantes bacterium]
MNNKKYICLNGDVIGSNFSKYSEYLNKLPDILKQMNKELNPLVPFQMFAGDEFQGLLQTGQNIFKYIDFLEYHLFPLRFRIGIGIGLISTEIKSSTQTMRGSAFVLARKAIELARKNKSLYYLESDQKLNGIGTILNLMGFIKKRWTEKVVFRRYMLYNHYQSIVRVAEKEKVSKEAVNKMIRNYGIRELQQAIDNIQKMINKVYLDKSTL